jgi:uncharacterized protein with HEPN domain
MRDDRLRLQDILEAIENIERRSEGGRDAFFNDEMIQVWVLHHVQIIGEAASGLSGSLRGRYPDVPWDDIVGIRNVLVHQYFGVDLVQVWSAVEEELPVLKAYIQTVLEAENHDSSPA